MFSPFMPFGFGGYGGYGMMNAMANGHKRVVNPSSK